jgi:hypothetical protein
MTNNPSTPPQFKQEPPQNPRWTLLVYVLPAQPSRVRVAVWRDLKAAGALYIRDGVAVLPDLPAAHGVFRNIANKVKELGGEVTLASEVSLSQARTEDLLERFAMARGAEYDDLRRQCQRFLHHLKREADHYEFTYGELEELAEELEKVRRWTDKVRARDYFGHPAALALESDLCSCEDTLAEFSNEAFSREHSDSPVQDTSDAKLS